MSMYELAQQVNETVSQYIFDSGAVQVCASEAGLDERCGEVYISAEHGWIATEQIGSLEYYGGFEYVGSGYKERIGEYMFYSNESSNSDIGGLSDGNEYDVVNVGGGQIGFGSVFQADDNVDARRDTIDFGTLRQFRSGDAGAGSPGRP